MAHKEVIFLLHCPLQKSVKCCIKARYLVLERILRASLHLDCGRCQLETPSPLALYIDNTSLSNCPLIQYLRENRHSQEESRRLRCCAIHFFSYTLRGHNLRFWA